MIEVKKLVKNYNEVKAVQCIDFTIKHGEVVGFLGSNGAGKSTTLKILTGYLTPTSGQVLIDGLDINNYSYEIKKFIGYLPESNPLYSDMTVFDLLKFTATIRNISGIDFKNALDKVVEQCGLKEVLHKQLGECSKGYKQRVGLAASIIHNPKILILDEPVTGLDPNQIVEIRQLIKSLGKEKLILMSSHILQEIEATVDRIMIIDHGKIIADGSTNSLMKKFMGNEKLKLNILKSTKDSINLLPDKIENISIDNIKSTKEGHIVDLSYKQDADPRQSIFKYAVKNKWILIEMRTESANLETIFRKLTN